MMSEVCLKNGETLSVKIIDPIKGVSQTYADELGDLIIQPKSSLISKDNWFYQRSSVISIGEAAYIRRSLNGMFKGHCRDHYYVGHVKGRIVGNVKIATAIDRPDVGCLGAVFTDPNHQGKGIGTILSNFAINTFELEGGKCLQLGTESPIAHHIYEKCGFQYYNGHIMRWLADGETMREFDTHLFADTGNAKVREANWGDIPKMGYLYSLPNHPWFIKDYREGIFSHPTITPIRFFSIFAQMILRAEASQGLLLTLESPSRWVVGVASLLPVDLKNQRHVQILDYYVHPNYFHQTTVLLETAIEAAKERETDLIRAYLASNDSNKNEYAVEVGFSLEATLRNQFKVGGQSFDLEIYKRKVNS